jgi:hypothetical protein
LVEAVTVVLIVVAGVVSFMAGTTYGYLKQSEMENKKEDVIIS